MDAYSKQTCTDADGTEGARVRERLQVGAAHRQASGAGAGLVILRRDALLAARRILREGGVLNTQQTTATENSTRVR